MPLGKRRQWCFDNNISKSCVYRWVKNLENLDQKTLKELRRMSFIKINHLGTFPKAQKELKKRFDERRGNGNKVTYSWLKATMQHICQEINPPGYDPDKHVFGNHWCKLFCKRHRISLQRATNTKAKHILEKIHLIKNYHYFTIYKFGNCEPTDCFDSVWDESEDEEEQSSCASYSDDAPTDDEQSEEST